MKKQRSATEGEANGAAQKPMKNGAAQKTMLSLLSYSRRGWWLFASA